MATEGPSSGITGSKTVQPGLGGPFPLLDRAGEPAAMERLLDGAVAGLESRRLPVCRRRARHDPPVVEHLGDAPNPSRPLGGAEPQVVVSRPVELRPHAPESR